MDNKIEITPEFLDKRPLSYSSLKAFRKSPRHFIEYLTQPRVEKEEFVIGNACECLILEPEKFDTQFELYTKFEKRSNDAKALWAQMVENAKANKKQLINDEQFKQARIMADSVLNDERFDMYLSNIAINKEGQKEIQKQIRWTDKKTGLPVIAKLDFVCNFDEHLIVIDLKSTVDGDPNKFFRQAGDLDYELQVGCYLTAYHKKYYQFPDFIFITIEKEIPFSPQIIYCPSDYCNTAKDEFEQTLTAFKYCLDNNLWHQGYEFWLFDTKPYFTMEKPKYIKSKFMK